MVKVAIVQGRLSSQVGDRYQYFPIHAWRDEFEKAAELGFDGIMNLPSRWAGEAE